MRVLGISGSLRRDSHNTRLLRAAAALLPPGAELVLWEGLKASRPTTPTTTREPRPGACARSTPRSATPTSSCSPRRSTTTRSPAQLKNALDWLSRPLATNPLRGKPVAVVGASTGLFGAVWAQAELRKVLGALGARVVDRELPVGQADAAFTEDGCLAASELEQVFEETLAELLAAVEAAAARTSAQEPQGVRPPVVGRTCVRPRRGPPDSASGCGQRSPKATGAGITGRAATPTRLRSPRACAASQTRPCARSSR